MNKRSWLLAGIASGLAVCCALPAEAQGCSVCAGGECIPVMTSGNCNCNIKHTTKGFRICRPVGVCDPYDPGTCQGGGGPPPTGIVVVVDTSGILQLEDQDPLVGTAVRAITEQTFDRNGECTGSFFRVGIHEGSFRNLSEEVGYEFRVVVSPSKDGTVSLRGELNAATGETIEFRGQLLQGGGAGRVIIERDHRGPVPRTLTWAIEKSPKSE